MVILSLYSVEMNPFPFLPKSKEAPPDLPGTVWEYSVTQF